MKSGLLAFGKNLLLKAELDIWVTKTFKKSKIKKSFLSLPYDAPCM